MMGSWFSRLRCLPPAMVLAFVCTAVPLELVRTVSAQTPQPTQAPEASPTAIPTFRTEIVVTPERGSDRRDRLPVSTAILTGTEIERLPATMLADIIQALPGFQMLLGADSGVAPAPVARGFFGGGEAEYVKLLVDGIPVSDAESGVVDWRSLPTFAIDRIEALRGPGSALYGDTALGGVIQAFTARRDEMFGRVDISGGSFGARNLGGEFSHPVGPAAALSLFASFGATDGFRPRSALREGLTSASFRHSRDTRHWTARGSFNYLTRQEPGALSALQLSSDRALSDPMFGADRETNRRGHGAIRFASEAGRLHYSILGHLSVRGGDRFRTLLLAPGVGDRAFRDISTRSAGLTLENSLDIPGLPAASNLRFGFDAVRSELDTTYHALEPDDRLASQIAVLLGDRTQLAAYATQSVGVGDRVRLHGGVRWDHLEDRLRDETHASHDAWSPRLGAAVLLTDAARPITAFGQVSRAFKTPTMDQLFDPRPFPDFRGGTFLVSNPALEPQRATNIEGGVRQSSAAYRWEFVLYRMAVKNEIDFDPATFTYGNIGRSVHSGAELDAVVFQGSRVAAAFNYAWTRVGPDVLTPHGAQLKNIPRHLFRPELTITLPRDTWLHVRYTRTAGAFADDQNLFPLMDRSTVDLRLATRLRRFTVRFDLLNVSNDRYEEVGFTLPDFRGGAVPFYYPAQGFSIRAGLGVAFHKGR